jgi:hypothetical protein
LSKAIFKYREARAGERGLFAVDEEGLELLGALKPLRDVKVEIKRSRNPQHHRLFFAILKFVQMHCPLFEGRSIDSIKDAVKLATNLAYLRIDRETGRRYYVLRSMSWDAMDQTRFNRFFDDACVAIAQRWMPPGTTPEAVRNELLNMVGGVYISGERAA